MICHLYQAPEYLFFAVDTPPLLYYSHVPTILIAIVAGLFVFLSGTRSLLNRLFMALLLTFATWTLINLIAWTSINAEFIAFLWPFFGIFFGIAALLSVYFTGVFVNQRDISFSHKLILLLLLAPLFLLAVSDQGVNGFDLTECDAFAYEGHLYKVYYNLLGLLAIIWNACILISGYRKANKSFREQIIYIGVGVEILLITFFTTVFSVIYLMSVGFLYDSRLEMYGLLGVLVFIITSTYSIVKYNTFNVKLNAPIALVVGLWLAVFSLLFLKNADIVQVVVSITLFFLFILGYALIRSVKKEVKHREQIERFAQKLRIANARLKELDKQKTEFVSIASHQLKSPLTAISGYSSMLKDGDFGPLPEGAVEPVERIYASARSMAESVEEYLNVSMIEAGSMKFSPTDFNLRDEVEHICNDLSVVAMKKGLLLYFKTSLASRAIVNADLGKIKQSIHNLIGNAIKYTDKGKITVTIYDDLREKRIFVEVADTGIGMTENTLYNLFQKFERAENASRIDTQGVGLGLYVAYRLVESMGGSITAHSAGAGMGSKFIVELPLVM